MDLLGFFFHEGTEFESNDVFKFHGDFTGKWRNSGNVFEDFVLSSSSKTCRFSTIYTGWSVGISNNYIILYLVIYTDTS